MSVNERTTILLSICLGIGCATTAAALYAGADTMPGTARTAHKPRRLLDGMVHVYQNV